MAGVLVAVVLAVASRDDVLRHAVPLAWVCSLAASRLTRRRRLGLLAALIGGLIVADHVDRWGSDAAVERATRRSHELLTRLFDDLVGEVEEVGLDGGGLADASRFDRIVARVPSGGILVRGEDPLVWSGDVWEDDLPEGTWVLTTRRGSSLAKVAPSGPLLLTAQVTLPMRGARDTVVALADLPRTPGLFSPTVHLQSREILAALVVILVLEVGRCRARGRRVEGVSLVVAGRLALSAAHPQGGAFAPLFFSAPSPLLQTPGDALATAVSLMLLASLLPPRRVGVRGKEWATLGLGVVGAGGGLLLTWRTVQGFFAVPVEPLEVLATSHSVWALAAAAASLFASLAFFVAWAPAPLVWLVAVASMAATGLRVDPLGALMVAACIPVLTHPRLWLVTRSTLLVGVACAAVLPRLDQVRHTAHRAAVERLAARLSSDHTPWFTFLARETMRTSEGSYTSLYDLWRDSPLRRFSVAGQLLELTGTTVTDRLSFGLRHDVTLPATGDSMGTPWEDVTEELLPPRLVVNAATRRGERIVVVSLVADLLAVPPVGSLGRFADGTPWPRGVRVVDRGLLSFQEQGAVGMGWWKDQEGVHVFRFQREFADGPHLVDLVVARDGAPARVVAFLAIAGLLCLAANGVLTVSRLWAASSLDEVFYRYRDRLLLVLLLAGIGPVVSLVAVGPSLERAARERSRRLETTAKAAEVAEAIRLASARRARDLAAHVGTTPPAQAGDLPPLVPFDPAGTPLGPWPHAEPAPSALARVVASTGRMLLWVDGVMPSIHALVPHQEGALLVRAPVEAALGSALAGSHEWSAAAWRHGKRVAAVLAPRAEAVPSLLPRAVLRALAQTPGAPVSHGHWAFSFVPDDLSGESLVVGLRREGGAGEASQSAVFQLWALGILLPLVSVVVLLSSLSSKVVTTPVSTLISLASQAGSGPTTGEWPRFPGELGELSKALEDMTTRLASSAAEVARERDYLETVLDQIDSGVLVADEDLSLQRTNPAVAPLLPWLTTGGTSLIGGPLEGICRQTLASGAPSRQTVTKADEHRIWQVGAAPLGHPPRGIVVVLEETTELVERQRLLTWTEFAREAAHEIKNPLTPIKLSAQHIRRAYEDGVENFAEVLARATEMIERQTERMEEILRDLSSFAKATGRPFRPVNVGRIVAQVVGDYGYFEAKGILVRLEEPVPDVEIEGDPDALRTLCVNIVDNAVKAVGEGGSVTVRIEAGADAVTIRCDDTGEGIPPEMLDKVFEPGFSLRPGGTGLGLPICRSVVAAHGGTIHAMRLPSGTRVEVRLPRRQPLGGGKG